MRWHLQVPPAELEILIIQYPGVAAVGVVGVPDETAGELPRAYVVKKEGSQISEEDILQYVAGKFTNSTLDLFSGNSEGQGAKRRA